MKNIFFSSARAFLLFACFFTSGVALNAQGDPGTDDDNFIVRILSPASIAQDLANTFSECGWFGSTYGPSLTEELCGEVVWAMPDSLGCTPLPAGSLDGKIAFIRRGICNFSLKVYHAQQAGAKAVIIVNHYDGPLDQPCATYIDAATFLGGMAAGDSATAVVIPSVYVQRETGEAIDGALNAGQTVNVCFTFPSVLNPFAAYHYATPVTQISEMNAIGFNIINRENTSIDMVIKADIIEPGGNITTLESTLPPIAPGVDTLVFFDPYTPPAVVGKYEVVFSNNLYTTAGDTLRRTFEITEHTFAVDNLELINAGLWNNTSFQAGGLIYQTGALYFTGPNEGTATYSSFGISNIDSIYTGNSTADVINVLLYDADSDDDGILNFQTGGFDDISGDVVALGTYVLQGNETSENLVHVPLEDFFIGGGEPPTLKANHAYYLSLLYDGTENGSGRCPGFNASSNEDYLVYDGNALTTPLLMDALYSGWNSATIANRLEMDGFVSTKDPKQHSLDASKFSITPNPGNEYINLNLDLEKVNERVAITILTPSGRLIRSQHLSDFQSGQVRFDVKDVPSGTYLMWIRTAEGNTIKQVAICH